MINEILIAVLSFFLGGVATAILLNLSEEKCEDDDIDQKTVGTRDTATVDDSIRQISSSRGILGMDEDRAKYLEKSVTAVAALSYDLDDDEENSTFLSEIIEQLWGHINIAAGSMIKDIAEPIFKETLPAQLSSMHFTKIDLGKVPIKLNHIHVRPIRDGVVKFNINVVWDGECDIDLHADYIGSLGVEAIKMRGRMAVLLCPLTDNLPVTSAIQCAFMNPPEIDIKFTGLASVANHLSVTQIIKDIVKDMMVLPNRKLIKMNPANNYFDTYQPPLGIIRVAVLKGRGFRVQKFSMKNDDVPDVYCKVKFGSDARNWRTSTVKNTLSPKWANESADYVLFDVGQNISIDVWDEDDGVVDKDDHLGSASISVAQIHLQGGIMEVELNRKGKKTGAFITLTCDNCECIPDLSSFASPARQKKNDLCGLLTILVTKAFDIPVKKEEAAAFIKVSFGSHEFITPAVLDAPGIDALNPLYDSAFHVQLTTEMMANTKTPNGVVVFNLMNGKSVLGTTSVAFSSLLNTLDRTITETRAVGNNGASFEFRVALRGLQTGDFETETPASLSPTGTPSKEREISDFPRSPAQLPADKDPVNVRVTVMHGGGFKVQKHKFSKDDVPDVYCNIKIGSNPKKWKTSVIKDDLAPVWNESSEFSLSDINQVISMDAFDKDTGINDPDDFLGSATITVKELLRLGGMKDVELEEKGEKNGCFVALRVQLIDSQTKPLPQAPNLTTEAPSKKMELTEKLPVKVQSPVKKNVRIKEREITDIPAVEAKKPVKDGLRSKEREITDIPAVEAKDPVKDDIPSKESELTEKPPVEPKNPVKNNMPSKESELTEKPPVKPKIPVKNDMPSKESGLTEKPSVKAQTPADKGPITVRITALKGKGFKIQKHKFSKDDVPDVYCKIKIGSNPKKWKTSVIKNDLAPVWNESSDFVLSDDNQVISMDALDEDTGFNDSDDFLGSATVTVKELLQLGGTKELELVDKGKKTGSSVTLRCDML